MKKRVSVLMLLLIFAAVSVLFETQAEAYPNAMPVVSALDNGQSQRYEMRIDTPTRRRTRRRVRRHRRKHVRKHVNRGVRRRVRRHYRARRRGGVRIRAPRVGISRPRY